jgi:hypothetical protein
MNLALRIPMGSMFTLMGTILTIFGVVTNGKEVLYAANQGLNANLCWGPVLFVFGMIMLFVARRRRGRLALASLKQTKKALRKRS